MSQPVLDKIIGSSPISRSNLSVHYKTGACAFSSHSFFSLVLPKDQKRYDLEVADDCREITSIAFSNGGQHLVIGEIGPNARFFILTFSEQFDKILTNVETRTKENGFSCLAMSSETGRLITVGNDLQPFFLLWDTNQPRPTCIGCYHLPVIPTNLRISGDGMFAMVSGNKMLKFIDTSIQSGPTPVILKSRNVNIGQFKDSNFISCAISVDTPYYAYGLTNDGILCSLDSASIPFNKTKNASNLIVIVPNYLNCGETTSISLDKKIILVGTSSGSVLAIKKEKNGHNIFGQFSSEGKGVVTIGIGERLTSAAYSDGHLMFWQRKINSQPILTLPSHRGPVCGLCVMNDCILSCGSDATVRCWKVQVNKALIGISSQEQICCRTITKVADNYASILTGVRCIAAKDGLVFAGDNGGNLHLMKLEKLEEIKKIIESFQGVMCISVHPDQPYVGTGGGDGKARIYKINNENKNLALTVSKQYHSSPITAVAFTPNGFVSTSSEGIRFCQLPSGDVYSSTNTSEPLLSLATIPSGKAVVTGGCDGCVSLWLVKDGSLFRRHKLSPSSYPLALAVDKAGLFIAVALSDGTARVLDLFSGDTIYSFNSHAGIITSVSFHESDLLFSSFGGSILRWTMPQAIHTAITERMGRADQPLLDILRSSENLLTPQMNELSVGNLADNNSNRLVRSGTVMKGSMPDKNWVFEKIDNNKLRSEKPLAQEINSNQEEEDEEVEQTGFDAPRPSVEGEYETKVDDLVRMSFIRRKKEELNHQNETNSNTNSTTTSSSNLNDINNDDELNNTSKDKDKKSVIANDDSEPSTIQKIQPPKKKSEIPRSKYLSSNNSNNSSINISNDKESENSKIKVSSSKADEMNMAALNLKNAYEKARDLLSMKPSCPEEIAAQSMIQNAMDMIKRDLYDVQAAKQIKEYAQFILSAVDKL